MVHITREEAVQQQQQVICNIFHEFPETTCQQTFKFRREDESSRQLKMGSTRQLLALVVLLLRSASHV